jgi:hypothetical protein
MPGRLRPGVTDFVVRSRRRAGFQLARPVAGYTRREAARDINRALNRNNLRALRRFEANVQLLGGVSSRRGEPATFTVRLPRGRYWAMDTMPAVLTPAAIRPFEVSGRRLEPRRLPGRVIRAVGQATFGPVNPRLPARGRIRFHNRSEVPHFLGIDRLARGATMKDFRQWAADPASGPPPLRQGVGTSTSVVSSGRSLSFAYQLPPGRYVLTCWWPDAEDGVPHAAKGMYRRLVIE